MLMIFHYSGHMKCQQLDYYSKKTMNLYIVHADMCVFLQMYAHVCPCLFQLVCFLLSFFMM